MLDLSEVIKARSDQLNAIDLMTKPELIKITGVKHGTDEQKLTVSYEGDNGKPWKPCLTMIRLMIALWETGNDGDKFVGKSVMLYRDPDIRFGRDEPGGIRISHASHIDLQKKITLPISKGRFGIFIVDPIVAKPKNDMTEDQHGKYKEAIEKSESMADMSKVAKKLKAGYFGDDKLTEEIRNMYSDKKDAITGA